MAPPAPDGRSAFVAIDRHCGSMRSSPRSAPDPFDQHRAPLDVDLIGVPCVVAIEDGGILVKRLKRGSQPDLYDLDSDIRPVIRDVRLCWVAEIISVISPRQAQRIIVRA